MEYHVPSAACLTGLAEFAMTGQPMETLSDNAFKCGVRHFDCRLFQSCAVMDAVIAAKDGQRPKPKSMVYRALTTCISNPILLSHLSDKISELKGAAKLDARVNLLRDLERQGLGVLRETRKIIGQSQKAVAFHRHPLSHPGTKESLERLDIDSAMWSAPEAVADEVGEAHRNLPTPAHVSATEWGPPCRFKDPRADSAGPNASANKDSNLHD